MRTRVSFLLFAATLACLGIASFASPADALTFKVCVRVNVEITDSDVSINGITEDYYLGTGAAGGVEVIGRGFRVRVTQGAYDQTFNAATTDGCFSFSRPGNSGFGIRVYGYATDGEGNHVRIHDGGLDTSEWYPGATYSAYWENQTLEHTNTYVLDGSISDRWTTIGVAAFGLYRWNNVVNDATVSIGFDEGDCGGSSSMWGSSTSYIESDNAHLMRVGRCAGSGSEARQKMLVTHELGHSMARLHYGHDGVDDPLNTGYAAVGLSNAAEDAGCLQTSGYSMTSLEWNSLGFKEGFADFYSARVWNSADHHGVYTRFGTLVDLETWDAVSGTNTTGGFTVNVCGHDADGVSTRQDYVRYFWDLYTACTTPLSQHDMLDLYRAVRENDRVGAFDLTDSNYDDAIEYAVENSLSWSSCQSNAASTYLPYNHGG